MDESGNVMPAFRQPGVAANHRLRKAAQDDLESCMAAPRLLPPWCAEHNKQKIRDPQPVSTSSRACRFNQTIAVTLL
jgi:hypothetical protein